MIDGENNTDFNKFKEVLKHELKKLASSNRTDENHLREILDNMKLFFDDEESLVNYYSNKGALVEKIIKNTSIPRGSELPSDFADIIINNIKNLVTIEDWSNAICDTLTELSRESLDKLEKLYALNLDIKETVVQGFGDMHQKIDTLRQDMHNISRIPQASPQSQIVIKDDNKLYLEDFKSELFLDNNENEPEKSITLEQMYVSPHIDSQNQFAFEVINEWYKSINRNKKVMFVFGDAGVGKSSLCSKIICDAYYISDDRQFCISANKLHICRLRSKIKEIEEAKINSVKELLGVLFEFKKYEFDNDLFILDGFDELCVLIKKKELIYSIINKFKQFIGDCKILITSRNSEEYFDDNILKSSDKIKILNIKWKSSNIDAWCRKYAKLTSSETIRKWCNDFPEKYNKFPKDDERREIFCVPIILYISAKAEIDVEEHNSVGKIYDEAFRKIAHRNYSELQEGMDNFDENEEKQRLINWQFTKEVAYQMFLHDTLYISNTRASLLLDNAEKRTVELLKKKHSIIINKEDIKIPQYLAMFHFARPGKDGEGIEFAHKTVYEYFTAVKLYEDYFAYINSDYPEPDSYESLEKVWTNIIEAFRYKSIPEEIFAYLNKMERSAYKGKVQEDPKEKFDYKKFERHYIEGMKQHILADLPVVSRVKEYIVNNELLTTQICCAFRNLTWFLTDHGYCNEGWIKECMEIKSLISVVNANVSNLIVARSDLNLHKWDLSGISLENANLHKADLSKAKLYSARLRCADLFCANLIEANLKRANLRGADLEKADLGGADLTKANLTEAYLQGADLTGVDFTGADFTGARYGSSFPIKTIFPEGFDPKEHGMIEVDVEGNPI